MSSLSAPELKHLYLTEGESRCLRSLQNWLACVSSSLRLIISGCAAVWIFLNSLHNWSAEIGSLRLREWDGGFSVLVAWKGYSGQLKTKFDENKLCFNAWLLASLQLVMVFIPLHTSFMLFWLSLQSHLCCYYFSPISSTIFMSSCILFASSFCLLTTFFLAQQVLQIFSDSYFVVGENNTVLTKAPRCHCMTHRSSLIRFTSSKASFTSVLSWW